MPLIHCIPANQPITTEEIAQRLSSGWVYVGQMIVQGSGVVDPSKPMTPTGAIPASVWVLPEPMVPAGALVQLLANAYVELDKRTLNELARQLFGQTVPELVSAADSARREEES